MAFTAIPSGDVWVQIGTTQTPTSGSSVSFTSIPAVKKIRLVVQQVALTASANLNITLNNDTSAIYNLGYTYYNGTSMTVVNNGAQNDFKTGRASGAGNHCCDYVIDYTNQAVPKLITGVAGNNGTNTNIANVVNNYNSTAVITRLDLTTTSTFNATNTGTIAIYGAF